MKVARTLVTCLLLGAIIAGFTGELWVEEASGVITSYSTTTSYSTWSTSYSETITSTQFATSRVTSLKQFDMDGPFLRIKGTVYFSPDTLWVEATITNLMNVTIDKGTMYLKSAYVKEINKATFGVILPGATITLRQNLDMPSYRIQTRWSEDAYFEWVDVICGEGVTMTIPVATYTNYNAPIYIRTEAYTITRTFTVQEPFLTSTTTTWLIAILAGVGVIVAMLFQRRKTKTTPTRSR